MSVRFILVTGLARALGTHFLGDLAGGVLAGGVLGGAVKDLKDYLTLDGRDLAAAFQDSLARGASAIALGISPEGAGVLTRLSQGSRRAMAPKIAQVYAGGIETDYLTPYAEGRGLDQRRIAELRRAALALCRTLAERGAEFLPPAGPG